MAFRFVLLQDGLFELLFRLWGPRYGLLALGVLVDLQKDASRLLAAHDRDASIGPHPEKTRATE